MPTKALARKTDPSTSYNTLTDARISQLQRVVLTELWKQLSGLTTKEIASRSGVDRVSISPRMKPLVDAGLVEDSKLRRDKSIVWWLTPDGLRTFADITNAKKD